MSHQYDIDDDSARVLLVDDDLGLRKMIGILLEKEGLRCTRAENSEEALLCLENQGFELVIVDKNLPGLSGLQLARIIHLLSPQTPIVIITGFASEETAREAAALGVVEYIRKPIDIEKFRHVVRDTLRRSTPVPGRSAKRFQSTFPPGTLPAIVARLSEPPRVEMQDDDTPSVELFRGISVLLVERDDGARRRLAEILGLTGSQVASFKSLHQARVHVERHGFDLLIAGREVLVAAGGLFDATPRTPLGSIAIMRHGGLDEVIDAIELKARGVISPPFVATNVMLELGRVMKGLADERTARAVAG
jgi:DNA-binding NtrC family response regulator